MRRYLCYEINGTYPVGGDEEEYETTRKMTKEAKNKTKTTMVVATVQSTRLILDRESITVYLREQMK
jgi:23S rRNA C2498 (ribose-2'-O)-methylase RlmM